MKSESWKLVRRTEKNRIPQGVYAFIYTALGEEKYKCVYFSNSKKYIVYLPGKTAKHFRDWNHVLDYCSEFERQRYLNWPRPAGYYSRYLEH